MRIELGPDGVRRPVWPDAIIVRSFAPDDAESLHALLVHGYRGDGGRVGEFETWSPATTTDPEFEAELCFLACSPVMLAGAALCWNSGFVKDLVVHESWRRQGLGEALLRHSFAVFAGRGIEAVELKVDAANVDAIRLYGRLGMRRVEP